MDVARKVVIAARESGLDLSLEDITVQGLVPKDLEQCSVEEYIARLPEADGAIAAQAAAAAAEGMVRLQSTALATRGTYFSRHSTAHVESRPYLTKRSVVESNAIS